MRIKPLVLLLVTLLICSGFLQLAGAPQAWAEGNLADHAVSYLYNQYQENGTGSGGLGAYDAYILKSAGVDLSTWMYNGKSLSDAVTDLVYQDLGTNASAKRLAQDLLAMQALGKGEYVTSLQQLLSSRESEQGFDQGDYSIYSNVAAYDLLCSAGQMSVVNATYARDYLLENQKTEAGAAYGSWGTDWGPDFMLTAEAVRALACLDPGKTDDAVQQAIARGCDWMREQQQEDGSFTAGMDDPLIDTVEAVSTQLALDLEPDSWTNNGHSAVDYLEDSSKVVNADGSFGSSGNVLDAAYALNAYTMLGILPQGQESGSGGGSSGSGARVRVRVEGATANLADKTVTVSGTALDALKAAVGSDNVSAPGGWITSIMGESGQPDVAENTATGWFYYVIRNGAIDPVSLGSGAGGYDVQDGDQVVFYIGAYDTGTGASKTYFPVVSITPAAPTAGQTITISISAEKYDWQSGLAALSSEEVQAIGDYTVTVNGKDYTSSNGQVTLTGVAAGTLSYSVTNQNQAGYPNVVPYRGSLSIASNGSNGGSIPSLCTPGVAVVGMNGELLFGPATVTIPADDVWGNTALGALDATGLSYVMSDKWSGYVTAIEGQAGSGMEGWMYTVNDVAPTVTADQYPINSKAHIIWYYSKSMDQAAPTWSELSSGSYSGYSSDTVTESSLDQTLTDLQGGKITVSQGIDAVSQLTAGLKAGKLTTTQKETLAKLVDSISQAITRLPDKALTVNVAGDSAEIRISDDLLQQQIAAIKKAAELGPQLQALGLTEADKLVVQSVSIPLPDQAAGRDLICSLGATAAQAIITSSLNLVATGEQATLTVPPETVGKVLEAADQATGIMISIKKMVPTTGKSSDWLKSVGGVAVDLELVATLADGTSVKPRDNFPKGIEVSLSLTGVDLSQLDPGRLAVYRQQGDGDWEYVGGSLSSDGRDFTFTTDHCSVYALMQYNTRFSDIKGHWAQPAIDWLFARQITSGISRDSYGPEQPLTRAQFAAFLVKVLGLTARGGQNLSFSDVPASYWGCQAIEAAAEAGLVSGTGNGRFEPERNITRQEMATVLDKVLQYEGKRVSLSDEQQQQLLAAYTDRNDIAAWAADGLAACINAGLIKGRTSSSMAPLGLTTRAEAAVVVKGLMQYLGS